MGNPIGWVELVTEDPEGAERFYTSLFDWKVKVEKMPECGDTPAFDYRTIDTGAKPGGGIIKTPQPGIPNHWSVYMEVADIQQAAAKVKELGGTLYREPFEIPHVGWIAVAADPQGAAFNMWQAAPMEDRG